MERSGEPEEEKTSTIKIRQDEKVEITKNGVHLIWLHKLFGSCFYYHVLENALRYYSYLWISF